MVSCHQAGESIVVSMRLNRSIGRPMLNQLTLVICSFSQTWFTSKTGIRNKRLYVASAVWDACPPNRQARSKWGIARIAVIAHECAHFLGLPGEWIVDNSV